MRRNEADRGWWSRNWGWCVGCGCLLPVLLVGACGWGSLIVGKRVLSSNGAVERALTAVNGDARATQALGRPIEASLWHGDTQLEFDGRSMNARFGVRGPNGNGRLRVEAHRGGEDTPWVLDRLLLDVDGRDETINLLEAPTPAGAGS